MRKINIHGETELSTDELLIVNKALYYAVREHLNQKVDESKTEILEEALNILKGQQKMPKTKYICTRSLDDFFSSCVNRGWEERLKEIPWLKVGD
ncbi:MAG: hypothetical protein ACOC4Y_02290 [bacterium]